MAVSLDRAQQRANAYTPGRDTTVFRPAQPTSQGYQGNVGPYSPGATSRPVDRMAPNAPSPSNTGDVSSMYQQYLGRPATAQELASDQENLGKYGQAQLESNLRARAVQGGSPVSPNGLVGPAQAQPAQQAPAYQAGQLPQTPLPTYQAAQFAQFQNPLNPQVSGAHNDLMLRVLQSPESMNPLVIAQMQEQQKEAALQMQAQQMGQLSANAAARGVSGDGAVGAVGRRIGDATRSNILQSQRDINIAAAQTNQQDRLNALGAGNSYQSGLMGNAVSGYGALLGGQQAQANDMFRQNQTEADAVNFALQRAMQQEGLYQAQAASQQQAFGQQQQADQFGLNYGLNLSQLEMQKQQQLQAYIQSLIGGGMG